MYIRFVSPQWCGDCRTFPGFFGAIDTARDLHSPEDWRFRELSRVNRWFCDHLDVPRILERRIGRQGLRQGVCWFRDTASEHITQARYACWLIEDMGLPIRELRSRRPGPAIWEDDHQIVAIPESGRLH